MTATILVSILVFQPVSSAGPGILYATPTPEILSASVVGSIFTIQIQVLGMDQFNGWDIQVASDPATINATTLSISGNMFSASGGTAFEIVHCTNGKGSGCTSADGPGIVHSAYGNTAFASGSGLLFTITFQVVGRNPSSPITIQNDLLSSSSPSGVPHTTLSGSYWDLAMSPGGTGGGRAPLPE
jgi:hypothetical protein